MQWYYFVNGEQAGPVDDAQLESIVADGTVTDDTLVWNDTLSDWCELRSAKPTSEEAASPEPVAADPSAADTSAAPSLELGVTETEAHETCCSCNAAHPLADMIQYEGSYVCAACKPTFFQRVEQGAVIPGRVEYGGFWLRGGAKLIDQIVLSAITTPLSIIMTFVMGIGAASRAGTDPDNPGAFIGLMIIMYVVIVLVSIAVPVIYHTWMVGKYGATLGKMACRLRVVRSDMSTITYKRACGRYFGEMVTGFTFGIGYLIAAFDDEKKALHDIIADTRVIKRS